jgi:uncharacterized membrane protein
MKPVARSILHSSFRTGITLKGIDGILEVVGAILIWFVDPAKISEPVQTALAHELSRDPHDFVAAHLLHMTERLTSANRTFAFAFLLSHGLVKIIIVAALWMDQLWAYPLGIGVFSAFGVYQVYRWTHTHSFFLVLLTIFDVLVIYLTWAEYVLQKRAREPQR